MMWVLDYLSAVESDFSYFHRVDDIYSMESPRFFRLVEHLPALPGAVQQQILREQQAEEERRGKGKRALMKSGTRNAQDTDVAAISNLAFETSTVPVAAGRR